MKKLIALLLAVVMLLTLAACNGDTNKDPKDDPKGTTEPADDRPSYSFSKFGNGKVTIVGAEFAKDDYDEDFLRVYYDYTNTDTVGCCPYDTLDFEKVTQNGKELDQFTPYTDDEYVVPEDQMAERNLQPGMTMRCTALFECSPEDGVVEIACKLMIGSWAYNPDDLEWLEFRIDPKDMMGKPEAMEYTPISNPTYTKGMPTSGLLDCAVPFEAALESYELTECEGVPALRVYLTYTNKDDESWPPCVVLPIYAYQDGIGLMMADTWYMDDQKETDEMFDEYAEPGQSLKCSVVYLLRSESPVEVVIEESDDYLRLGMLCDVSK